MGIGMLKSFEDVNEVSKSWSPDFKVVRQGDFVGVKVLVEPAEESCFDFALYVFSSGRKTVFWYQKCPLFNLTDDIVDFDSIHVFVRDKFLTVRSSFYSVSFSSLPVFTQENIDFSRAIKAQEANGIYSRYLKDSNGRLESKKVISFCKKVLSSDVPLEVESCSLVVLLYKLIELDFIEAECWVDAGNNLIDELEKRELKNNFLYSKCGIREDLVQVYFSLNTAMWHLMVFIGRDPSFYLEKIVNLSLELSLYKTSYSLNVGASYLLLAYLRFLNNKNGDVSSLARDSYQFFKNSVNQVSLDSGRGLPTSSHYGDLMSMMRSIQILLSGNEWVLDERERKDYWNDDEVMRCCSRVSLQEDSKFKVKFSNLFNSI